MKKNIAIIVLAVALVIATVTAAVNYKFYQNCKQSTEYAREAIEELLIAVDLALDDDYIGLLAQTPFVEADARKFTQAESYC